MFNYPYDDPLSPLHWKIIPYNISSVVLFRLESEKMLKVIEDLGLISDVPIMKAGSPLDTVSALFIYPKNLIQP